ncbi:PREDICTED: uncharacterized protein LOC108773256 [Cyphomyrmex costatus]|uniref:Shugoshin C-terminal domain-containing protein n=1 Tax=Cyphomyrmex costatus TaxID=456900 RepID=A0A195CSD1_9HYME|nr:PREDICTED: uncharacterized protein LOC108773256 [Cyphomyrmex costatus]KYN03633.1 hypothetical protein ALC62_05504 [Cyphomyrmex costatus]
MPKMSIRKFKRVGVLANKRSQILKTRYKEVRSYRPLCEKLKHNNSHLAKALSKEKQNSQTLFTQNIELVEEIQQLNLICNTRNTVISNVLNNAKEILKMLVTMTGYMTNTISMCQELVAANTAVRLSASTENKESSVRLSTKSPAKGVVKPMVGGHTITKPTINLSRVNMEDINVSRLSDIPEVTTPTRSLEITENRSPIISLPSTPLRYENGRPCRLPERLTISSPRVNDEQRLRRNRRSHSKRLSVSFSRSRNRWSNETPSTAGHINVIDTQIDIQSKESRDDTSDKHLTDRINAKSESQVPINSNGKNETHIDTSKKDSDVQINNKISNKDFSRNSSVTESSKLQNNTRTWEEEDPLEGPSWLFNNTIPPQDNEPELENVDVSDVNNNTSQVIVYDESSVTESNVGDISNSNESMNDVQASERYPVADRSECNSFIHEHDTNDSICEILPTTTTSNDKRSSDNIEDGNANDTMKFTSFVTLRRGHSEVPEETEDFTLMLRQSRQNMKFNINELRLPVLDESVINNSAVNNEIDTKVTTTLPRNTSIPIASVSNQNLDKSDYNHITIKLPIILVSDHKRTSIPQKTKHSNKSIKKSRTPNMTGRTSHAENSPTIKNKTKLRNKSKDNRDPSTAKVVLEKLNESHVKPRTAQNINSVIKDVTSDEDDNQRDLEGSIYTSNRPRRRKAPTNLKEPTLNKKLRRG